MRKYLLLGLCLLGGGAYAFDPLASSPNEGELYSSFSGGPDQFGTVYLNACTPGEWIVPIDNLPDEQIIRIRNNCHLVLTSYTFDGWFSRKEDDDTECISEPGEYLCRAYLEDEDERQYHIFIEDGEIEIPLDWDIETPRDWDIDEEDILDKVIERFG